MFIKVVGLLVTFILYIYIYILIVHNKHLLPLQKRKERERRRSADQSPLNLDGVKCSEKPK